MSEKDKNQMGALPSSWKIDGASFLLGIVLILVLVPMMQWLDRGAIVNDLELDVPNPLGVGLIVALVLINAVCFAIAKARLIPVRSVLILYVMLSISLPMCSVGLMGPLFGSIQQSTREVCHRGNPGKLSISDSGGRPGAAPPLACR